jgi:hypothetical protein
MVGWTDPRVIVAICAAVISALALIWNVQRNKRTLKVKVNFNMVFERNLLFGNFTPAIAMLEVQMANASNDDVRVKLWTLKLNKKIGIMGVNTDSLSTIDISGRVRYPMLIKKGDIFKDQCPVRELIQSINNQIRPYNKIRIIVTDTLDKNYKSKKFKYKSLLNLLEAENLDAREKSIKTY